MLDWQFFVIFILKNFRIIFFHSGEEKTEPRACFVKKVGDFFKTVGDFFKKHEDFFKKHGDFFLKAGRKNLQPPKMIKKTDILHRNFSHFNFL